ncbi:MAG: hypothetical protein IPP40_05765 [bacterium]|nr:hypothetical protein [bacterium]
MSKRITLVLVGLMGVLAVNAAMATGPMGTRDIAVGVWSPEEILEQAYQNIQWYEEHNVDVPEDVYDFYFLAERLVHPEYYSARDEAGSLDQFADACPGTVINGPDFGEMYITSTGSTMTANNDCSTPNARLGRDVMVNLNIFYPCRVTLRTAGSVFDTFLVLYEDNCCDSDNDFVVASNNNDPYLNYGQRLAAGLEVCLFPGDYYIVLDGASSAARGSYRLAIAIEDLCNEGDPSR